MTSSANAKSIKEKATRRHICLSLSLALSRSLSFPPAAKQILHATTSWPRLGMVVFTLVAPSVAMRLWVEPMQQSGTILLEIFFISLNMDLPS